MQDGTVCEGVRGEERTALPKSSEVDTSCGFGQRIGAPPEAFGNKGLTNFLGSPLLLNGAQGRGSAESLVFCGAAGGGKNGPIPLTSKCKKCYNSGSASECRSF